MTRDGARFPTLAFKTVAAHTVTYFLAGVAAVLLLDYPARYADPAVSPFMRPTDSPWVAAGPLVQPLRGLLFALAFYPLRRLLFGRHDYGLTLGLVLVVVGILSPFGPAPGSVEGLVYTKVPWSFQLLGLPEVLIQALLFAVLLHHWVNHPEKRWLTVLLSVLLVLTLTLAAAGLASRLGSRSQHAQQRTQKDAERRQEEAGR